MSNIIANKVQEKFSSYQKRIYPKGQLLLFADEEPKYIYYVTTGKVRMFAITYRGEEVIVNIFKTGAFFPMSWAINKVPNTYFYKTEEETTVHLVPPEDAIEYLHQNPDVLFDLLSRVYGGIDGLLGRIVHLMSGSAKSRLIYELIIESKRFGKHIEIGKIKLDVNEQDLAARAGMSRETVSREMQALKAKGWISIGKHGGIEVLSLKDMENSLDHQT